MKGYVMNPDKEYTSKIIEGILKKDGHCPCRVNVDESTLCPCDEFVEKHICKCNLFVKRKIRMEKVTESIRNIGVYDKDIELFENQYIIKKWNEI